MDKHFSLPRHNHTRALRVVGRRISIAVIIVIAANYTFATEPVAAQHYQLNGVGTLALDALAQQNDRWNLKAALSPSAMTIAAPPLQSDRRFALTATLAVSSLVCYGDTIFRDNFDGDGL